MVALNPLNPRVSIDPSVCHGKPVIAGTRVMVATVLGCLAGGDSVAEIVDQFGITREDVLAAVAYAGELVSSERHFPLRARPLKA
jgi:uncharacterized protein (DUF433 family)